MSAKQQLAGMIDFMGESEASRVLQFVKEAFVFKPKTWDDIPEDEPLDDELEIFAEHRRIKNAENA